MNAEMNSFIPHSSADICGQSDAEDEYYGHVVGNSPRSRSDRFYLALKRQIDRVNEFYRRKESELKARFKLFNDHSKLENLSQLKDSLVLFQQDLAKLQNFADINETAVRKIVKKWKKRVSVLTEPPVQQDNINFIRTSFNTDSLAEMNDVASNFLSKFAFSNSDIDQPVQEPKFLDEEIEDSKFLSALLNGEYERSKKFRVKVDGPLFLKICSTKGITAEIIQFLLDSFPPIDFGVIDIINRRTGIHYAAETGNVAVVDLCAKNGVNPFAVDILGKSPIDLAAANGHSRIVKYILDLDKHAALSRKEFDGPSPLIMSVKNGHIECVKVLLESGVSAESQDRWNPLCIACEKSATEIVALLISAGASISRPNPEGYYPLHIVCQNGCLKALNSLLLHKNATIELERKDDYNRLRPIFYAAINGNADVIRVLIKKGCSIECHDDKHWFPLTHALWNGNTDIANLLECGRMQSSGDLIVNLDIPPLSLDGNSRDLPSLLLPPPALPVLIYKYPLKYTNFKMKISGVFIKPHLSTLKLAINQYFLDDTDREYVEIPYTTIFPIQEDFECSFFATSTDEFYFLITVYPTFGRAALGQCIITSNQIYLASNESAIDCFGAFSFFSPILGNQSTKPLGQISLAFSVFSPILLNQNAGAGASISSDYRLLDAKIGNPEFPVQYCSLQVDTIGKSLGEVMREDNISRIAIDISVQSTWLKLTSAVLNESIDRIVADVLNFKKDVVFLSNLPFVCQALTLKFPQCPVFFKSDWNQGKGPRLPKVQRSLKEGVKFCKANNLAGLVCSSKSLLAELVNEIKKSKIRVLALDSNGSDLKHQQLDGWLDYRECLLKIYSIKESEQKP